MADYTVYNDNYDEIEFLESEIEDDDNDAPLGVLIVNDNGKVRPFVRDTSADETAPVAEDKPAVAETPATTDEQQPAETAAEETPSEQPVAEEPAPAEEPVAAPVAEEITVEEEPAPAPVAEETPVTESAPESVAEEDGQPSPEDIAAYAIVYNPDRADAAVSAAMKQEEAEPVPAEEPAPAPVAEETPAAEPVATEVAPEPAPVEEKPAEAVASKPAPAKKSAPKKKAATVTIQKAASADDVWGSAVITTTKKSAPKEKSSAAAKENTSTKEEKPVVKKEEKPAAAKKTATKADAKETKTEKAAKAPAKDTKTAAKSPAKAKEETKAAKPATKAAEATEQVLEEGDASAPHGKFVIKKTENNNFVYKLYSSNHRVVAIGAGLYTSIASCKSGINSVRNNAENAPIEDQTLQKWEEKKFPKWQIYFDKKGEVRLRLLASNGNIVATTNDGYLSRDAAKKGIEAIARAAKGSSIVRNDDLW